MLECVREKPRRMAADRAVAQMLVLVEEDQEGVQVEGLEDAPKADVLKVDDETKDPLVGAQEVDLLAVQRGLAKDL